MAPGHLDTVHAIVRGGHYPKVSQILEGGETRNDTTLRALDALEQAWPPALHPEHADAAGNRRPLLVEIGVDEIVGQQADVKSRFRCKRPVSAPIVRQRRRAGEAH